MNEWFPYYLALGMTYEQYWCSDPYLTVYYQKARKMKFDYDNQMAWINGMYIYDAVSAIVFNTWCRKEGEQCKNYTDKPYEFDEAKQEEELKSCYLNCMKLAEKEGLKSIAFCCISTGEFHFPNKLAAEIAVKTVDKYLSSSKLERVIFNVFKEEDYNIYKKIFA